MSACNRHKNGRDYSIFIRRHDLYLRYSLRIQTETQTNMSTQRSCIDFVGRNEWRALVV